MTELFEREVRPDLHGTPRGPRAVILLLDGTWNDETGKDGDGVVTNIVKLYRSLVEDPRKERQIVRYFRGVGNDEEYSFMGRFKGGVFGQDERRIRHAAYATLAQEWRPGDRIFVLGFSRGAASARMLASQIAKEGIPEVIRAVWEPRMNRFTRCIENRFLRYEASGDRLPVDVEFLGVWDTVGAFGIPMKVLGIPFNKWNLFRDMTVASNVKRAVHLVSIDETRTPFTPTLMNHQPDVVEEVWFPGVHSDVGGGYLRDALGSLTLEFMVERMRTRAAELGLELDFDPVVLQSYLSDRGDYHFHFHGLGWKKALRKVFAQRADRPDPELPPKIHASVLRLRESRDTYSFVQRRRGLLRRLIEQGISVRYNPANLRELEGRYEIVGRDDVVRPHARPEGERFAGLLREPTPIPVPTTGEDGQG